MKTSLSFFSALVAAVAAAPANITASHAVNKNATVEATAVKAQFVHGPPYYSVYADVGVSASAWPTVAQLGKWNDL